MLNSKFKWNLLYKDEINDKEDLFDVLLNNRNVFSDEEKQAFFSENYNFYDPFLFNDMNKVVKRINDAILNKEKIMIYGDFDVDGVTGTAIMYKTLKSLDADVYYYIPNRFLEGYGPNMEAFKIFVEKSFKLIITVDNGITGVLEAKYLSEQDVDLIITDHHEAKDVIPEAIGIIHPKLKDEKYPFKELSGCGVAFKLAHALLGYLPIEYIDLASLGTYADIVSLVNENRLIVKLGIKQLQVTNHLGIRLLTQIANIKSIDENTLGFVFGPRLNAPGRMDTGNAAVRLLVTEDYEEAYKLANDIEQLNNERKAKIDVILEEANQIIEENEYYNDNVIVVAKDNWHEGVLGIIANKLVEQYNKPVIILTNSDGLYKGSARTLEDFPLFENLDMCSDILKKYGGHKMAAGLSIEEGNLDLLRKRLHDLAGSELYSVLNIDCIVNNNTINKEITFELEKLRPYGSNNQKPLFLLSEFQIINIMQIGVNNKHLKLYLKKNDLFINAVAFNMGNLFYKLYEQDIVNVVGNFEINEYNNKITNQIIIRDISCSHKQLFDYRNKQFVENNFLDVNLQYIYFNNNYGYNNALCYTSELSLKENIVLIDIPYSFADLKKIYYNDNVNNLYLLFNCNDIFSEESLITRDKLIKIYQVFKKYKKFNVNDINILSELERFGFNKKIQIIAIRVFFDLNFVIIEGNEIIIVENPIKRNLTESKTFQDIINSVNLKEKLLLSTSVELKEIINNL